MKQMFLKYPFETCLKALFSQKDSGVELTRSQKRQLRALRRNSSCMVFHICSYLAYNVTEKGRAKVEI